MKITNLFNAYLNNSIILSPLIAQICNLNTTVSVLYIRIWNFLNTQFNFFDYILTYWKKVYHKIFIKSKKWCSFHQNWKQDGFYIKLLFFFSCTRSLGRLFMYKMVFNCNYDTNNTAILTRFSPLQNLPILFP